MAGGFAHITLVDALCKNLNLLDGIETLTSAMKRALAFHLNYVELGSVSPDYPYFNLLNRNAAGWANVMHYWNTMDIVRHAVSLVYNMDYRLDITGKCMAWLFGYAAHVVTDMTIHPVVNLKVGAYERYKRAHRVCEMNQDVYIFHKVNHQEITRAEYIKEGGIASCCAEGNRSCLEPAVARLWKQCLPPVPGTIFHFKSGFDSPSAPPDPDLWHRRFIFLIDGIAEEGGRLPFLTRHIAQHVGLVYPPLKDLDRCFIDRLPTPEGYMSYDEIFHRTQENVIHVWSQLGRAMDMGRPEYVSIPNGNLDTGRDESGRMIFWKELA